MLPNCQSLRTRIVVHTYINTIRPLIYIIICIYNFTSRHYWEYNVQFIRLCLHIRILCMHYNKYETHDDTACDATLRACNLIRRVKVNTWRLVAHRHQLLHWGKVQRASTNAAYLCTVFYVTFIYGIILGLRCYKLLLRFTRVSTSGI